MTYQSRPWSALDAIVSAGRTDTSDTPAAAERPLSACDVRRRLLPIESKAGMLLSHILNATTATAKPCIQFVACNEHMSASAVAMAACYAAATVIGRSLLLNARMDHDESDQADPCPGDAIPDAFMPNLYHHRLSDCVSDLDLLFGRGRRGVLTSMTAPFDFVAIDSQAPNAGPASTALAPMCTGTVLVVRAGRNSHRAVKDVSLNIIRAGGRVIGSVLDEAPANLPSWIRRT